MEFALQNRKPLPATMVIRTNQYFYLDAATRQALDEDLNQHLKAVSESDLWERLCSTLPLNRGDSKSLHRRVEGLDYIAEKLWALALESGKGAFGPTFDRENLRRAAGILPISHYHYLMGSREPWGQVLTRRDALHDPQTALLKLKNDIHSLSGFIRNLPLTGAPLKVKT